MSLSSFSENASRLGMRIQETLAEHTRDLPFAKSPNAALFDTTEDKVRQIRKQLDSNQDREKLEAMKRLIAMISKGRNVSEFFAQVVKNVASPNLEIRKLVYIYLLRYAESEPDLALLSINTFQKDLSDSNPLIRAMALRVLSGIRVPVIGSIMALGIKKCASDISPYVRKAAALAVSKCYSLDPTQHSALMQVMTLLLRDQSPLSIGAVAVAFDALCPSRLDLLHQHYRRFCRLLIDADEWGQVNLLELLGRYARTLLSKPDEPLPKEEPTTADAGSEAFLEDEGGMDPDLALLFQCAEPLFQSRNAAVVLAVVRLYYYLAPTTYRQKIIRPMLRIMHISPETERVVLEDIAVIASDQPSLLKAVYTRFLLRSTDLSHIKRVKLRILVALLDGDNYHALLREFKDYLRDTSDDVVMDATHAIGTCARLISAAREECLKVLLGLIRSHHDISVNAAVLVLKSLIVSGSAADLASSSELVSRLALRLHSVRHPQARAAIIWLVGQYAPDPSGEAVPNGVSTAPSGIAHWAPDVLRVGAKSFSAEADAVKLQLVTLAAKLVVLSPSHEQLTLLCRYVLSLARFDSNYDLRDRARMLGSLLQGVNRKAVVTDWSEEGAVEDQGGVVLRREQVRLILYGGKVPPTGSIADTARLPKAVLGSLSLVLHKPIDGDRRFPQWPEEGTDTSLRDTEEDHPVMTYAQAPIKSMLGIGSTSMGSTPIVLTPTGGPSPAGSIPRDKPKDWTDLDKFYAEESDSEESEEESEEESDTDREEPRPAVGPPRKRLQENDYFYDEDEDEEEEDEDEDEEDDAESVQGHHADNGADLNSLLARISVPDTNVPPSTAGWASASPTGTNDGAGWGR